MVRARADMRRPDLALPYVHSSEVTSSSGTTFFSTTLPMTAMLLKSKLIAWCALFTALQQFLNRPLHISGEESSATPDWMSLGIAIFGVVNTYLDFVFKRPVPANLAPPEII